jgi:DegV family protein with EDD domain
MQKTIVITDTDSSLPPKMAEELGILQVPIGINFGDDTFITGLDINDEKLFKIVDEQNKLPTTSAPNPKAFTNTFESAFAKGAESIICICVSSKVSSTFEAANKAKESFPNRDIHVIDSNNLTMAQGYMVLAAAEAAANNCSVDEIIAITQETGKKVHTFAALSTLKYLYMGGRVTKLQARLAETFEIKPMLTVKNGELTILGKNRTQKKSLCNLVEHIGKAAKENGLKRMAIIHVNEFAVAQALESVMRDALPCPQHIDIVELTPGLSVHTGSGMVGVVFQTEG